MKRIPQLRPLSEDHHLGLVLARTIRHTCEGRNELTIPQVWDDVDDVFPLELEPHFKIEEDRLVPALIAAGESEMAETLLADHRVMRSLVRIHEGRTREDLAEFGRLLEKHIRFEERELFPRAQEVLGEDVLNEVEREARRHRADIEAARSSKG